MKSPGIETIAETITTFFFLGWNLIYGVLLQTPYPQVLVSLYQYPLWRILLLALVFASAFVSLPLALMVGLAVFFYFMDMPHFLEPWK